MGQIMIAKFDTDIFEHNWSLPDGRMVCNKQSTSVATDVNTSTCVRSVAASALLAEDYSQPTSRTFPDSIQIEHLIASTARKFIGLILKILKYQ